MKTLAQLYAETAREETEAYFTLPRGALRAAFKAGVAACHKAMGGLPDALPGPEIGSIKAGKVDGQRALISLREMRYAPLPEDAQAIETAEGIAGARTAQGISLVLCWLPLPAGREVEVEERGGMPYRAGIDGSGIWTRNV